MDIQERIAQIEEEIRETPYHKGTEHHIGLLRARLARLEDQILEKQSRGSGGGGGFAVKKTGDATLVLVGPPSAGKSTLLNSLTNARSPVAPYSFTTVSVIPGMMFYRNAMIQILDVPGLIEGAAKGKGRGREVLSVVRGADLIIFISEFGKEELFAEMEEELSNAGVRINKERPKIRIEKKARGGVEIRGPRQNIPEQTLEAIFREFGFKNAEIMVNQRLSVEELVDALSQNRIFVPAIYVINKIDLNTQVPIENHLGGELGRTPRERVLVSGKTGAGLEDLREVIWGKLNLVRVYLAKPGSPPDYGSPLIMKFGQTLLDVAGKIGQAVTVKEVRISGPGSKFPNQQVSLSHQVLDEMVVTFL